MVLHIIGRVGSSLSQLYLLVLLARMVLDWVKYLLPQWNPRSAVFLAVANAIYALTDPPLRFINRYIPPLRLGQGFALDVGYMVLFIGVILLQRAFSFLMYL